MYRARAPKLLATIAAALLILASLQPALAADNRSVFFGSPGTDPASLTPTKAIPGYVSSYVLRLENLSSATLTQVRISGGKQTPDPLANPSTPPPSSICASSLPSSCVPAIPAGASFADFYVYPESVGRISCTITDSSTTTPRDGLTCPVSNLASGQSVQIRILLRMPTGAAPTSGSYAIWNAVQLKEGSSTSGGNPDVNYTVGSVPVNDPSCGAEGVSNWFLEGEPIALSNDLAVAACAQETGIGTNGLPNQGTFLNINVTTAGARCAQKLSCFGGESNVLIEPSFVPTVAPQVDWHVRWNWGPALKKVAPKGIIHFDDVAPGDPQTQDIIYFSRSFKCSATLTTNCWTVINTDNKTFFEVFFTTDDNGSGRGF